MSTIILLDSGPLGLVTNPRGSIETLECSNWLEAMLLRGFEVQVPEIADYEIRRELLRANKFEGIKRLDQLKSLHGYIPLTTLTMLKAAELWAQMRRQHTPTADDKALDGDVILAAQAVLEQGKGNKVIVATTNVGHLSRLIEAKKWRDIQ